MIGKILTNELNSLYIVGNLTGRILLANCQIVKFIKTPPHLNIYAIQYVQ